MLFILPKKPFFTQDTQVFVIFFSTFLLYWQLATEFVGEAQSRAQNIANTTLFRQGPS